MFEEKKKKKKKKKTHKTPLELEKQFSRCVSVLFHHVATLWRQHFFHINWCWNVTSATNGTTWCKQKKRNLNVPLFTTLLCLEFLVLELETTALRIELNFHQLGCQEVRDFD